VLNTIPQLFLSYSGDDSCEAGLLQFAIESLLGATKVKVWTFQRDQPPDVRSIAGSLKKQVQNSCAVVFLASPSTVKGSAAQWMELAYADAFEIPTFVLLHRISYSKLKMKERGVPPFLTEGNCTPSTDWRKVVESIRPRLTRSFKGVLGGA
jgi:hypothetical protein